MPNSTDPTMSLTLSEGNVTIKVTYTVTFTTLERFLAANGLIFQEEIRVRGRGPRSYGRRDASPVPSREHTGLAWDGLPPRSAEQITHGEPRVASGGHRFGQRRDQLSSHCHAYRPSDSASHPDICDGEPGRLASKFCSSALARLEPTPIHQIPIHK